MSESGDSSSSNGGGDVPFYLMPVAAILGIYTILGSIRTLRILYVNVTYDSKDRKQSPPSITLTSVPFLVLVGSIVGAVVGYAKIVAMVDVAMIESEHALFDPYDTLGVDESFNVSSITQAYRSLVKIHHPDKGGSQDMFVQIQKAYRALTDEEGMKNFKLYGHPDGRIVAPSYKLALPQWLLFPEGNIALIMIVLYFLMLVGIVAMVFRFYSSKDNKGGSEQSLQTETVGVGDLAHLVKYLSPTSTHMDILLAVATTPENIEWSTQGVEKAEALREEKRKETNQSSSSSSNKQANASLSFDQLVDQGGWDDEQDDEEEDDAMKEAKLKAKQADEEKKLERERLARATGKQKEPLEGVDEGVLGQKWVESALQQEGYWWTPESLSFLKEATFPYKGKQLAPLDHPGIRRNLCCTLGRLHSRYLNTKPELVEAGTKKLLDQTYFKAALEYRHRTGILLEACLRLAVALKCYPLTKTVVETAALFKVGCKAGEDNTKWFEGVIMREYGILPRLSANPDTMCIETEDEEEIATGDLCTIKVDIERTHAEIFMKKKIEMYQKQGIPPQVALQTFREGWWFLVRGEKLDGTTTATNPMELFHSKKDQPAFLDSLKSQDLEKFYSNPTGENSSCLVVAWPVMIANAAQKGGTIKMQFKAPKESGKYRFYLDIMSQEFLGADQQITLKDSIDILELEEVQRKQKEKEEKEEKENKEEMEDTKKEPEQEQEEKDEKKEEEEEESKKDK